MQKIYLVQTAQDFINYAKDVELHLDYSLQSLSEIDSYLSKTYNPQPNKSTLFFEDTNKKLFALSCYFGEVLRRNTSYLKWEIKDNAVNVAVVNPKGEKVFTVDTIRKRIHEGERYNLLNVAQNLLNIILKFEDEIQENYWDNEDIAIRKYASHSAICLYSKAISLIDNVVEHISYDNDTWTFVARDEDKDNLIFELKFLEEIKSIHPELSSLLDTQEDNLRITRQNDGSYRTQKPNKHILGGGSMASFQGNMNLNILQWIRYNFKEVTKRTFFVVISLFLTIQTHWAFVFLFLITLLYKIFYWYSTLMKFKSGDVNPGKVIDINPVLVAIPTDMRKYSGSYPVLKIIQVDLPQKDQIIGKIIPTIALYGDNPHGYPFWAEFNPVPIIHGCNNQQYLDYLTSQFSNIDIKKIDRYLQQIPNIEKGAFQVKLGIYKIDIVTSSWKDYSHVDLVKGLDMEAPLDIKQD